MITQHPQPPVIVQQSRTGLAIAAGFASFFIPGLGQFITGRAASGLAWVLLGWPAMFIGGLLSVLILPGIFALLLWVLCIVDAIIGASQPEAPVVPATNTPGLTGSRPLNAIVSVFILFLTVFAVLMIGGMFAATDATDEGQVHELEREVAAKRSEFAGLESEVKQPRKSVSEVLRDAPKDASEDALRERLAEHGYDYNELADKLVKLGQAHPSSPGYIRSITMEKFNYISTDSTTYRDLVNHILGLGYEVLSEVETGGITTRMLSWKNPDGSNMNVTLRDGTVVSKAQFGLPPGDGSFMVIRNMRFKAEMKAAREKEATEAAARERSIALAKEREKAEEADDRVMHGFLEAERERVAREQAAVERKRSTRTWTDATGSYKVEAAFKSMGAGMVVLVRTDNSQEISVSLESLSKADRDWIARRRRTD